MHGEQSHPGVSSRKDSDIQEAKSHKGDVALWPVTNRAEGQEWRERLPRETLTANAESKLQSEVRHKQLLENCHLYITVTPKVERGDPKDNQQLSRKRTIELLKNPRLLVVLFMQK